MTTRPITDKVKEAVFNIIGSDIQDSSFLDLFAGSGSVGIEALSRGAGYVHFVELNRGALNIIRDNLKSTGLMEGAVVTQGDAFTLLERPTMQAFDYVYIAPPQYKEMWKKALQSLDKNSQWLSEDAWVIVQIHPVEFEPNAVEVHYQNLEEFDQRHYGSTLLVFYRRLTERGEETNSKIGE
jgi:16S rRNA (guanine966-N2)-methyltransferase